MPAVIDWYFITFLSLTFSGQSGSESKSTAAGPIPAKDPNQINTPRDDLTIYFNGRYRAPQPLQQAWIETYPIPAPVSALMVLQNQ